MCGRGSNVYVALVMDRSGSMNDNNKINDAVEAALGFLDRMNLAKDRAAIISFSDSARVDAGLGSDKATLQSALNNVRQSANGGTAIGSGISAATTEVSEKHVNNRSAMVVLSDGRDDRPSTTHPPVKKHGRLAVLEPSLRYWIWGRR